MVRVWQIFLALKIGNLQNMGKVAFCFVNHILQETGIDKVKLPEIEAEELKKLLQKDFEQCVGEMTEAINTARAGAVIDDSEEPVRIAAGRLRQKIVQTNCI